MTEEDIDTALAFTCFPKVRSIILGFQHCVGQIRCLTSSEWSSRHSVTILSVLIDALSS